MGRKRPIAKGPRLSLKNYIRAGSLPTPPTYIDYEGPAWKSIFNIMGNDVAGDCHDASTEVLTERGWQPWPEYDGKSLLGTMNQITGLLEFQAPLSLIRHDYDGPMYFADHRSLDFGLTPGHRMFHRPYRIAKDGGTYIPGASGYGDTKFGTISTLAPRVAIPACTTGFIGAKLTSVTIGTRTWNGDDLIALLALIISDGYVAGGETNRGRLSFCCFREDRYDMVASFARSIEATEQRSRKGVWTFTDDALAEWVRSNCYTSAIYSSLFKRVPDLIKVASQSQVARFLQFFGDQSVRDSGRREFFSSSLRLIDDLQELLLHVGRRGSIHSRPQRDGGYNIRGREIKATEGHLDITLNEWGDRDVELSLLSRSNLKTDHYKGEVFCATVPNSTLVTRRNGDLLISGNCVPAGMFHIEGILTANGGGRPFIPSMDQVWALYSAIEGPPGYPAIDNGCDEVTALNLWQQSGLLSTNPRHKIAGWLAIDGNNQAECRTALWLFENLLFGFELPDAWVNPMPSASGFTWDVAGDPDPNNGHCVVATAYTPSDLRIATWGMWGLLTNAAVAKYTAGSAGGELYCILSADGLVKGSQKCPAGIDWAQMQQDFSAIGAA